MSLPIDSSRSCCLKIVYIFSSTIKIFGVWRCPFEALRSRRPIKDLVYTVLVCVAGKRGAQYVNELLCATLGW